MRFSKVCTEYFVSDFPYRMLLQLVALHVWTSDSRMMSGFFTKIKRQVSNRSSTYSDSSLLFTTTILYYYYCCCWWWWLLSTLTSTWHTRTVRLIPDGVQCIPTRRYNKLPKDVLRALLLYCSAGHQLASSPVPCLYIR